MSRTALLLAFARGWAQKGVLLLVPVAGGLALLGATEGQALMLSLLGYELTPYRVDRLSLLFGYLFHLAAFIGALFALHVQDRAQHVAAMLYAGSALGAVFAGDLITLFVFWELAALSSVFLVWARRSPQALGAGWRYLVIQIVSGLLLLAGVLLRFHETGSLTFDDLGLQGGCNHTRFDDGDHIFLVDLKDAIHPPHIQLDRIIFRRIPLGRPESGGGFKLDFIFIAQLDDGLDFLSTARHKDRSPLRSKGIVKGP